MTEFNKKDATYTLTLSGDVKGKQGKVKVVAKNNGGEASSEAELVISGRSPEFVEKPIKCTVLEGIAYTLYKISVYPRIFIFWRVFTIF